MKKYFSYDRIDGDFNIHETLEEAKKEAESALGFYRDEANSDGWPEGLEGAVGFGELKGVSVEKRIADRNDFTDEEWEEEGYSSDFQSVSQYNIEEVNNA